jgi:predicted SprT family Zn-dependent metalloprotease
MYLEIAEIKAKLLMGEHNLIQQGWTVNFHKGRSYLGQCLISKKIITLSIPYVENNEWEPNIKDTVLHEICHAFCPPVFRNRQWKAHHFAWRMKCIELGCSSKRTSKDPILPPKKAPRYITICACGIKHEVRRQGKHFNHYRCKFCKSPLVFTENPVYV